MTLLESAKQWNHALQDVVTNLGVYNFFQTISNGSSFLWISVISVNFKGSGKSPVLRKSFIHLHRICGNIVFPFKVLKGMSPPDDVASTNVEITSMSLTYMWIPINVVIVRSNWTERKRFNCNVFALDFLYAGVVFVFVTPFDQPQGWCHGLKMNNKLSRNLYAF